MIAHRKWKIVCLLLFLINVLTAVLWFRARWDYWAAEEYLVDHRFARAMNDADHDFGAGTLRLYRLEVFATGASRFTGEKDGAFELWTWPHFKPDPSRSPRLELTLDSTYVDTYNQRMRILHDRAGLRAAQDSSASSPSQHP